MRNFRIVAPIAALALSFSLSACASGPQRGNGAELSFAPNPTQLLTLDIAMNRAAQKDGTYAALRKMAADRAVMFVPRPVSAQPYLRDQDEPATAITWKPHRVMLSCDGKTGVTTGAIRWGDTDGYYTTVWQYFQTGGRPGDGEWRWVLSHGDGVDAPRAAPEMLGVKTASCDGEPNIAIAAPDDGEKLVQTQSADQSLSYSWLYRPDGSRVITVLLWDGEQHQRVLEDAVAAPPVPQAVVTKLP